MLKNKLTKLRLLAKRRGVSTVLLSGASFAAGSLFTHHLDVESDKQKQLESVHLQNVSEFRNTAKAILNEFGALESLHAKLSDTIKEEEISLRFRKPMDKLRAQAEGLSKEISLNRQDLFDDALKNKYVLNSNFSRRLAINLSLLEGCYGDHLRAQPIDPENTKAIEFRNELQNEMCQILDKSRMDLAEIWNYSKTLASE